MFSLFMLPRGLWQLFPKTSKANIWGKLIIEVQTECHLSEMLGFRSVWVWKFSDWGIFTHTWWDILGIRLKPKYKIYGSSHIQNIANIFIIK